MSLLRRADEPTADPERRGPLRRHPWRVVTAIILVLFLVWIIGGYFVVVRPATDQPAKVDAILVLGPPDIDGRMPLGVQLAEEGYASTVVVSVESEEQFQVKHECHSDSTTPRIICFIANPHTTQGEARELRELTAQYGWTKVMVITSSYHISRARMIVQRCFKGEVLMIEAKAHHGVSEIAYQYLYQTGAYLKAFTLTRGC